MTIKIEQIGSPIRRRGSKRATLRRPRSQRATLIGLGLNRIGRTVDVPDRPEIRGMIARVKHLVRVYPKLKVTFDSNTYRRAVNPSRFPRDAKARELRKINAALKDGRIVGYLSETLATLEGVQNAQRGAYFASVAPKITRALKTSADGKSKLGFVVEADDSLHPGLHPVVARWIAEADSLGLQFLRAPRIGSPRPTELLYQTNFAKEGADSERQKRLDRFMEVARAIETRGVGIARLKVIAAQIKARTGSSGPWYSALNDERDEQERREIERAVAEWADGDAIAAHIAYGIDVFCSEDRAQNASSPSIFDASNRAWLQLTYGIRIVSLEELAAELDD